MKDDIFMMSRQEDKSLEEYLERFLYNLQKSKYNSLNFDIIQTIFLKCIQDEYLVILNVMGNTYHLMKLNSYVKSIHEEEPEMEKGMNFKNNQISNKEYIKS